MKILRKHLKQGLVKVKVESLDDLWYLSHVIEEGDHVGSKTERKIDMGEEGDRKKRTVRRHVFLVLEVDGVEFHEHSNVLRVKGQIRDGPDEVSRGSYHTFNVEEGSVLEIVKDGWPSYLLQKLEEASRKVGRNVLIVCHDREEACFGLLTQRGLDVISSMSGDVAKKRVEDQGRGNFYEDVVRAIESYDEKYKPDGIVLASPGFWKEYSMKEVSDDLKGKVTQANCSVVGERGLKEVVKRPELKKVLEEDKSRREAALIDEMMEAISKDRACYGLEDCWDKVKIGAVKKLAVSEDYVLEAREEGFYDQVDKLMKTVEHMDGEIRLVSSEEEARRLDELGGVAGVLRWKT